MRKRIYAACALLLLLCVLGFTYQRPQYEYKIEYSPKEKKVNQLADEGWELVAVGSEGTTVSMSVFVFKRPK